MGALYGLGGWRRTGTGAWEGGRAGCLLYVRRSRTVHRFIPETLDRIVEAFCTSNGAARNEPTAPCSVPCPLAPPHPVLYSNGPHLAPGPFPLCTLLVERTVSRCRGRDMTETAQGLSETPAWLAARPRRRSPPSSLWFVVCDGDGTGAKATYQRGGLGVIEG